MLGCRARGVCVHVHFTVGLLPLQVKFDSGVSAEFGNELTPTQVAGQECMHWSIDYDIVHTLSSL